MKKFRIVICLLLALCIVFVFTGCGNPMKSSFQNGMKSIKNVDRTGLEKYFVGELDFDKIASEENGSIELGFAKKCMKNLSYKIIEIPEISDDDTSGIIKAEITNINCVGILTEYSIDIFGEAFGGIFTGKEVSEAERQVAFDKAYEKYIDSKTTETVDVSMIKKDNEWKIQWTPALIKAIFGGSF